MPRTSTVRVRVTVYWTVTAPGQPVYNRYEISFADMLRELAAIRSRIEAGDLRDAEVKILVSGPEERPEW